MAAGLPQGRSGGAAPALDERRQRFDANAAFPITEDLLISYLAGFDEPNGGGEEVITSRPPSGGSTAAEYACGVACRVPRRGIQGRCLWWLQRGQSHRVRVRQLRRDGSSGKRLENLDKVVRFGWAKDVVRRRGQPVDRRLDIGEVAGVAEIAYPIGRRLPGPVVPAPVLLLSGSTAVP